MTWTGSYDSGPSLFGLMVTEHLHPSLLWQIRSIVCLFFPDHHGFSLLWYSLTHLHVWLGNRILITFLLEWWSQINSQIIIDRNWLQFKCETLLLPTCGWYCCCMGDDVGFIIIVVAQYRTAGVNGSGERKWKWADVISSCGKMHLSHSLRFYLSFSSLNQDHFCRSAYTSVLRLRPGCQDDWKPGAGGVEEANWIHWRTEEKEH